MTPTDLTAPSLTIVTSWAPWYIINSNDKKRARLNCLSHFLSLFPYEPTPREPVTLPDRDLQHAYDDETPMLKRRWIPEKFRGTRIYNGLREEDKRKDQMDQQRIT